MLRNKTLHDSFVMLKAAAAAATRWKKSSYKVNETWLREAQWFFDFETFDNNELKEAPMTERDEKDPALEASSC